MNVSFLFKRMISYRLLVLRSAHEVYPLKSFKLAVKNSVCGSIFIVLPFNKSNIARFFPATMIQIPVGCVAAVVNNLHFGATYDEKHLFFTLMIHG